MSCNDVATRADKLANKSTGSFCGYSDLVFLTLIIAVIAAGGSPAIARATHRSQMRAGTKRKAAIPIRRHVSDSSDTHFCKNRGM